MSHGRALFIGRFQPFHKGHLEALQYIFQRSDEVIIGVGSAQYSHELDNPFTTGERITMITAALEDANIRKEKYYLIPIEDVNIHDIWVSYVKSRVPKFDIVYTNEALTSRLFREAKVKTDTIPFFNRKAYSATEIRNRIIKGLDWQKLVPSNIFKIIKEIDGDGRIRELTISDKPHPVET